MSTLSSSANATASASSSSSSAATFETPTLDPARAGLTNSGSPSAAASVRTDSAVAGPSGTGDRDPRRDRHAGRLQHDLHEVLVHAQRRIEHAASRVRDLERVEEALDRAVLAVDAVQDRQHDIDASEVADRAVGAPHAQRAIAAALGPQDAGAVVDHLGQLVGVERELVGVVVFEDEHAVAGDSDRDHPVAVTADRAEDAARRCGTDRVFAGATSKEHHHRRPVHSASSRPGAHRRPS